MYLDDILLQWAGHLRARRFVPLVQLVKAIAYYTEVIDTELAVLVNTSKTCMVASSKRILEKLGASLRGAGVMAYEGVACWGSITGAGEEGG